ncbi:hypothetical protein O6H91_05G067700 [Diphasiastrum complanatum]|uniref:Uncharacterized protein n=2 Tax=Diphasiastrum complanatum TaxID=34168 RepID=A0ACC2DPF8_DIPCM|nr:hypothetical protein O6H91_05G064900 [Diphasiastrum complanatum]KAJ7556074.1 hypothetical protein O6H91_05G067700 [Diphasiastrum complanatum]
MTKGDWKEELSIASRRKIITKLMEIFQKHLGFKSSRNIEKLMWILQRFEAKALKNAEDEEQYLKNISLKILLLESLRVDLLARAKSGKYDQCWLKQKIHQKLEETTVTVQAHATNESN